MESYPHELFVIFVKFQIKYKTNISVLILTETNSLITEITIKGKIKNESPF